MMPKSLQTKPRETKYIVIPKGSTFTSFSLGEFLNNFYFTEGAEAHFKIGTVWRDGFFIPHEVITKIKAMFSDWKYRFEFFSQEGEGEIRKYSIPSRKKSTEEKKVTKNLAEILARKKLN